MIRSLLIVATVLTVYGIETENEVNNEEDYELQQYLPFTVLKQDNAFNPFIRLLSCNSTYRLRY